MQLTFAGVPFGIDRPDAREWIGHNIPLHSLFGQDRHWPGTNLLGLTWPHHQPHTPEVSLGSWHYPTGAARWSTFYGLIAQDQYDEMVPLAFDATSGPTPHTFTMQQDGGTVSTP